ncbi:MAG: LLM class flavin-dependent oxidoreductase [Herbiconiux sp.]|uniref:LLM class flavin-dependent oxidoreductase n=1 Tax=Herbiconiux sp. TaxID=1871186 RepID=UPI00121CE0DD|nr:LLM class flavin-dependent oxidoreductase [Herbiconiux sp.]TAJ50168.1 MAG: LLM class flavin-dependent oxidoreductase [Herbiconiux sp.]
MTTEKRMLVGLVLDGVGADSTEGSESVARLSDAATLADQLGFDLIALDDPLARAADRTFRLSAVDALAFLARRTHRIGLVATSWSHYAEPFHVAKAIATIDFISGGRAGLIVDPSRSDAADRFFPAAKDLSPIQRHAEAAEFVSVVGDLWDSWEDGAEIRDRATGRYVDSAKVHHIDHDGAFFRVKGPLITPRPPQGRPPVFLADDRGSARLVVSPDRGPATDLVRIRVDSAEAFAEALAAESTAGTRVLLFLVGPGLIAPLLRDLRNRGIALPGSQTTAGTHLAERLGISWQPSRFATRSDEFG